MKHHDIFDEPRIYSFGASIPSIDPSAYIHPSATIIGAVRIGAECFVGPGAVLRGDNGPITMDDFSNIQDNAVVHSAPHGTTHIGRHAQIGHGAVVHGATIGENCIVGINAILLDGAILGRDCILAAGSVVRVKAELASGCLHAGNPAIFAKNLSAETIAANLAASKRYTRFANEYPEALQRVARSACRTKPDPLAEAISRAIDKDFDS
jgi:phenylacetic acid degradation protein